MFAVDTNLLVYAVDEDYSRQRKAKDLLEKWGTAGEPWFVTWSILYEFLRVATHRAVFAHPLTFAEAWNFIEHLHLSASFGVLLETDRHSQVLRSLTAEYPRMSGSRMHDLHIAALMREHGVVEIRTADIGFHEFKFLHVVNPL